MSSPAVSRHRLLDRALRPAVPAAARPAAAGEESAAGVAGRYRYDRRTGAVVVVAGDVHAARPAARRHRSRTPRPTCTTSTPRTGPGCWPPSRPPCATGRDFALETRIVRTDGRSATSSSSASAGRTTTARVTAVEGMAIDITECHPPGSPTERAQALQAEVAQLRAAMASRAAIEQAKGILMLLTSCSDQVAFDLLAHISSHTHRKVRDVALVITESAAGRGRCPTTSARSSATPARLPSPSGKPALPAAPIGRMPDAGFGPDKGGSRGVLYLIARFVLRPLFLHPAADRHRPGERAGHRPVHHREQPPVLHRQHGHPAHGAAEGRLPGQGRVLHRHRHQGLVQPHPLHRPGRAARPSADPPGRAGGARHRDDASCGPAAGSASTRRAPAPATAGWPAGRPGVAWLALTADCPVVPVAVRGHRQDPADRRRAGRGRTGSR